MSDWSRRRGGGQRAPTAAGGLWRRIRCGSRRVDAKALPGDEGEKRGGGGNDTGRRVRLGAASLHFIGGRDVDGDVVG